MVVTLFIVSLITFIIFQIIPGDPVLAKLGMEADEAQIEAMKNELGLDKPLLERYTSWISNAVRGDFGKSTRFDKPVNELIYYRFGVTMSLACMSLFLSVIIGIPLGILAAKYNDKVTGILISIVTQIGMSLPSFWVAILLMLLFGLILNIFSIGKFTSWSENPYEYLKSLFFPAVAIAIPNVAVIVRYLKTTMLEQMKQDYVRTAYSKGFSGNRILYKHVLRNGLIPVITIMGMIVASVLGGSIIIERVFTLPGIGNLLITAIGSRDFPLVQGIVMYIAFMVVTINFIVDILYKVIDPRISLK